MAWTAPKDWSVGEVLTAANLNTHLRDNLLSLATRELWVPVTCYYDGANYVAPPGAYAILNAANDAAYMGFRCPDDFGTITEAKIFVLPNATQASANWDIEAIYGGVGEGEVHDETDSATTYNVTNNVHYEVNAAGILTALAIGDVVRIILTQGTAGHNLQVKGFFMRYSMP